MSKGLRVDHVISRERREFCRETGDERPLFKENGRVGELDGDPAVDLRLAEQICKMIGGVAGRVLDFLDSKDATSADFTPDVADYLSSNVDQLLRLGVVPVIVEKGGNPYGRAWHGRDPLLEKLAQAVRGVSPACLDRPAGRFRLVNSPVPFARFIEPTKPKDLVEVWDEDKLGFQLDDRQASHMTVTCFEVPKPKDKSDKPEGKWSNMATVPVAEIGTHPNNEAWHYGAALFEGIGVEYVEGGKPHFFKLKDHWERMNAGARKVGLPEIDWLIFEKAAHDTVKANRAYIPPYGRGRLYLRPNYVDYGPHLKVGNSRTALFCSTAVPIGTANAYYPISDKPIQVALPEDRARAVKGGSGDVKLAGNYAGNLGLMKIIDAYRDDEHPEGFKGGLLFSDPTGKEVRESQASGVVFVKYSDDGKHKLVMPSLEDGDILDSVTSKTIKEVAPDLGYEVEMRHVAIDEIDQFDEALNVGTAVAVSPIHEISVVGLEGGVKVKKTVKYYAEDTTAFDRGEAGQALFNYLCAIKAGKIPKYRELYLTEVDFD